MWLENLLHCLGMAKPSPPHPHIAVHLDLTIEEFGAFIAIIRGDATVDPADVAALTTRLNQKDAALKTAVEGAP